MKLNKETCRRDVLIHMSTEQLDEMLQQEVQQDMPDEETVLAITAIIQDRESAQPVEMDDESLDAWEDFRKNCAADQAKSTAKKRSWVMRAAMIALVAGVLVMTVPQAVGADSFLEVIAKWTGAVFSFFEQPEKPDTYVFTTEHPGLQEIYEAVKEMGITQPVVPTWVPEEYELTEIMKDIQTDRQRMSATLHNGCHEIVFSISMLHYNTSVAYAKDDSQVAVLEKEGIKHYLMRNDDTWTVTWMTEKGECMISTDCQEDVLYHMLDSIYYTEDY